MKNPKRTYRNTVLQKFARAQTAAGLVRIAGLLFIVLSTVALAATGASAQTLTTLYSFTGGGGASPYAGLIADASGNLYGTTVGGGTTNNGTVFELTPAGSETVLHSFTDVNGDGAIPYRGLIADAAGNLYGTTFFGGASALGAGTVFKLTNSSGNWIETALYSFPGFNGDAENPEGSLIMDSSGNLYGTTLGGGANGVGTVFELVNSSGTYTERVLYSFTAGSDGGFPLAGLIMDASGNLYGTANSGGNSSDCPGGCGVVFKVTPTTGTEVVLYSFTGSDGAAPYAGLIADASGNLYGTTELGGNLSDCSGQGCGVVFELVNSSGNYTENVLYSFTGGSDGAAPTAGLIADASGNLYGTTYLGGTNNDGTVFKLTPSGAETVLHSFAGRDGANPVAELIADASGNLVGTTSVGGTDNDGTVFKLTLSTTFQGIPGQPNCKAQGLSFDAQKYGGLAHAASSLGYSSVTALQNAVAAYCGGS